MFCTEFSLNDDNSNDDDSTDGDDSGDSDGGCVALLPLLVRYDWPATALQACSGPFWLCSYLRSSGGELF